MTTPLAIAILPYLKTSGRVTYRDIHFRNSDDTDGLTAEAAEHLRTLASMFFLRDSLRIRNVTAAVMFPGNELNVRSHNRRLSEFQALVTYMYSAPHPTSGDPFLPAEHGSLFVFTPKAISPLLMTDAHAVSAEESSAAPDEADTQPDAHAEIPGYEGYLNGRSAVWAVKGSRIYPPTPRMWFNLSQDLHNNLGSHGHGAHTRLLFDLGAGRDDAGDLDERILTALQWYNRSIACDVEDDLAIASLAIAFESLLNLERGEKVTARFRQAVTLLLGPVPRLDSWSDQFYDARSDIMHDGRSERLMFRAVDLPKSGKAPPGARYRSLASYGRHIFRSCMATILSGMQAARRIGLSSLLQSNADRFTKILQELKDEKAAALDRLKRIAPLVDEIGTYRFVPEENLTADAMLSALRRTVTVFLAANAAAPDELLDIMRRLVAVDKDPDHYKTLDRLRELHHALEAVPERSPDGALATVASLTDSVWGYTFMTYYLLEQKKAGAAAPAKPKSPASKT